MHDKELGGGGVHVIALAGHGNDACGVGEGIGNAVGGKLALDLVGRAAHAGALGVTALDHKAVDDTVEDDAVIEILADKLLEVGHRDGGNVGVKLNDDIGAAFQLDLDIVGLVIDGIETLGAAFGQV